MYENRNFAIFSLTELNKIDFSMVLETSAETLRRNIEETRSFIKWDGETPEFVSTLETLEGPYAYEEMLEILNGEEWTSPMTYEGMV